MLLPKAEGEAKVEVKNGYTEITSSFKHVEAPTQSGTEYLTYLLWAITPDGRSINLGELIRWFVSSHDVGASGNGRSPC